jgi:hypothetical protein
MMIGLITPGVSHDTRAFVIHQKAHLRNGKRGSGCGNWRRVLWSGVAVGSEECVPNLIRTDPSSPRGHVSIVQAVALHR